MAQRRMFSLDIVGSDAFLDMPTSSQALYFHLGMYADDDGFVQPRRVMRLVGASEDDIKILTGKRFVLVFESGVIVIKHWLIHNLIRSDLYKETAYKNEKRKLGLNENGAYTELREGVAELEVVEPPEWLKRRRKSLRTANVPQTVPRIGKDRIGKDRDNSPKSISYLKEVPLEDIKEFVERFDISEKGVRSKAEDLQLYCERKGKLYKNYKSFLLNAIKKDCPERKIVKSEKIQQEKEMSEDEKSLNRVRLDKIKEDLMNNNILPTKR